MGHRPARGASGSPGQECAPPPAPVVRYGLHPDQVANLHLPSTDGGPWPCVVLIHGGFWRDRWDRTLMTVLAADLARRGVAAWNVEYRRVGQDGGGWPGTLEDVAAAVDALAAVPAVDLDRVGVCGHSAGGQLALWVAARQRLPRTAPGAAPRVRPRAAVAQAAVVDLVRGAVDDLGDGACTALLGGTPDEVPERYAAASPAALLPLGAVGQLLVHGLEDDVVPSTQTEAYAAAARAAGDEIELALVAGADHFDLIDPTHPSWERVATWLVARLGAPGHG